MFYLFKRIFQNYKIFMKEKPVSFLGFWKIGPWFCPTVLWFAIKSHSTEYRTFYYTSISLTFFLSCNLLPSPAVLERKLSVLLPICLYITSIWLCYIAFNCFCHLGSKERKTVSKMIFQKQFSQPSCIVFWSSSTISRWYNNTNEFSDVMCPMPTIFLS